MNVEQFKRFLELQGRRVIASESGYWYNAGGGVYLNFPYTQTIDPDPAELSALFRRHRILGVKYSTLDPSRGRPGAVYVVRDKAYDLHCMKHTARACVLKGLECCTVQALDFDCLQQNGLRLNCDTLRRQQRDDALFSNPQQWASLCQICRQVEGASAWGAFVEGQLAAYMIVFRIEDCYHIVYEMSCSDFYYAYPNHVLQYVAVRTMMAQPDIHCVSIGLQPIFDIPGLDRFKRYIGYEKLARNYIVVLHPAVRAVLLSRPGRALLHTLQHRFPQHDALKRISAITNIASLS